jgi:hypothetical protein
MPEGNRSLFPNARVMTLIPIFFFITIRGGPYASGCRRTRADGESARVGIARHWNY